jgi:magnesium transporter
VSAPRSQERLQESLAQVKALLERHRVLELMTHRQEGPKRDLLESLQHRQNLAELHSKVKGIHPADLAYILETLTPDERLLVWEQLGDIQRGEVLVEASEPVGAQLISATDRPALLALLRTLDADDLAYLAPSLPMRFSMRSMGCWTPDGLPGSGRRSPMPRVPLDSS